MTAGTEQATRSGQPDPGRGDNFGQALRAEWTKFRSVRGWVIGIVVAALLTVLAGFLAAEGSEFGCSVNGAPCHLVHPVGPGGEAVADTFYFVHQPLAGDGAITVRVTSMTGLLPAADGRTHVQAGGNPQAGMRKGLEQWAKAGLIIASSTRQGSAYAAVMATGSHGARFQYDYTQDVAGSPGPVSPAAPRWLRLTRSGSTITGYESRDGTHWTEIGSTTLSGLPDTVQAGLFVTSPGYTATTRSFGGDSSAGGPTVATAAFDHVSVTGHWPAGAWTGSQIGGGPSSAYGAAGGGYHQEAGVFTVTGSGDIAPVVNGPLGSGTPIEQTLAGFFVGIIGIVVVATIFMTAEYRRGLIRTTFAASPRRGRVLAAKAVVIAAVAFAAGLVAAVIAVPLNGRIETSHGSYLYPVTVLTELRVMAGSAAVFAVSAILAVSIGSMVRRSAYAVSAVIGLIILPYFLAVLNVLPPGASAWVLRLTPVAGFAIQQSIPSYPQVSSDCTAGMGCYPLAPWAGFGVLCVYAAVALALALFLVRRRDA